MKIEVNPNSGVTLYWTTRIQDGNSRLEGGTMVDEFLVRNTVEECEAELQKLFDAETDHKSVYCWTIAKVIKASEPHWEDGEI